MDLPWYLTNTIYNKSQIRLSISIFHKYDLLAELLETGPLASFPAAAAWVDWRGDWGNQAKLVRDPLHSTALQYTALHCTALHCTFIAELAFIRH
jgi:hypothetical protein